MVTQEELDKMSPEEIAELQKNNCIFCKIIRGEIPSKKVYEDSDVLAILDINPARKGHVLIMPKDHFPILPLLPQDKFEKLFSATKLIAAGLRKAMLVSQTTIFIANGGIAGQQSPHFLFHIFPRDPGDGLKNFDINPNPAVLEDQKSLEPSLKNNLNIMFSKFVPQKGSNLQNGNTSTSSKDTAQTNNTTIQSSPPVDKHEVIAKLIEENADVRNLLISDPDSFKEQIKSNSQLVALFDGIDIIALSQQLKSSNTINPDSKNSDSSTPISNTKAAANEDQSSTPTANNTPGSLSNISSIPSQPSLSNESLSSAQEPQSKTPSSPDTSISQDSTSAKKPEVFLGADPLKQRDIVFKYFEEKPKAKELLINDPSYFKDLLDNRPDVKELFENVNIDLLSAKLKALAEDSKDE